MKNHIVIASPVRAKQSLTRILAIGSIALGLSACGDDITEINANVGAVKTSDDLPECTEDIAGQTAFIKEDSRVPGLRRQGVADPEREHGKRGRQRVYLHEPLRRHGLRDFL